MINKEEAGAAKTPTEETNGHRQGVNDTIDTRPDKDCPVIARDVFEALPAFYRSALIVMERNGRCEIEGVNK